jgi:hypothetical protein
VRSELQAISAPVRALHGECCSNARADAKFAANLSQVSTFVPIFAAQATMKQVDLISTNQARHPATGR